MNIPLKISLSDNEVGVVQQLLSTFEYESYNYVNLRAS